MEPERIRLLPIRSVFFFFRCRRAHIITALYSYIETRHRRRSIIAAFAYLMCTTRARAGVGNGRASDINRTCALST